jgi:hypothetical protein
MVDYSFFLLLLLLLEEFLLPIFYSQLSRTYNVQPTRCYKVGAPFFHHTPICKFVDTLCNYLHYFPFFINFLFYYFYGEISIFQVDSARFYYFTIS